MRREITVMAQFEAVRRSGKTNMFDIGMVQYIASESDYHELVGYIESHSNSEVVSMGSEAAENFDGEDLPVDKMPGQIKVEYTI